MVMTADIIRFQSEACLIVGDAIAWKSSRVLTRAQWMLRGTVRNGKCGSVPACCFIESHVADHPGDYMP
jgi:hypothetical protein